MWTEKRDFTDWEANVGGGELEGNWEAGDGDKERCRAAGDKRKLDKEITGGGEEQEKDVEIGYIWKEQ